MPHTPLRILRPPFRVLAGFLALGRAWHHPPLAECLGMVLANGYGKGVASHSGDPLTHSDTLGYSVPQRQRNDASVPLYLYCTQAGLA